MDLLSLDGILALEGTQRIVNSTLSAVHSSVRE